MDVIPATNNTQLQINLEVMPQPPQQMDFLNPQIAEKLTLSLQTLSKIMQTQKMNIKWRP